MNQRDVDKIKVYFGTHSTEGVEFYTKILATTDPDKFSRMTREYNSHFAISHEIVSLLLEYKRQKFQEFDPRI